MKSERGRMRSEKECERERRRRTENWHEGGGEEGGGGERAMGTSCFDTVRNLQCNVYVCVSVFVCERARACVRACMYVCSVCVYCRLKENACVPEKSLPLW